ncbi:sigma-70 family RNA polymerase sigma factor [Novosphingobium sp.]|uniref:sigma-70 family RNA polymerase sigma factor n=1 Tax=Novosphingobium sp. TaxID=1874826 RepID=UPI003341AC06
MAQAAGFGAGDDAGFSLDRALMRVADGDRAAFDALYHRTSAKLFGVTLRILPLRHEAEEVLQDIYLSVWRRAATFDPARGSAMTWLITLARNRAVDRLRGTGRRLTDPIELADAVADPAPDAETLAIAGDDAGRLGQCLDRLDAGDARLIRTAFFDGASYAELAERTARPLGTIKSRIRRALIGLRECLA